MIGVRVGEHAFGYGLDLDAVQVFDDRYADRAYVAVEIVAHGHVRRAAQAVEADTTALVNSLVSFSNFPQLDRFVVRRQEKVSDVFLFEPFYFVYFLLDLE